MGTIRTSIQIYDGLTPVIRNMLKATNMMISGFGRMNTASGNCVNAAEISSIRGYMAEAEASFIQLDSAIERARQSQDGLNRSMSTGNSTASMLKSTMGQIGAVLGVKKVISIADEFTQAKARLDLMNDGLQTTAELQNKVYQSAQRSRAAYGDTVAVVSRLGILAGKAFSNNNEMVAFTELMNKNFIIGGTSQMEQSAAMYQLTQAMAAGKLQGDEYRSIIENAPLLAKSIEDYMINVQKVKGTMKDWASDGMLTAEVIKAALFNSTDEIEAKFANMPVTWGQVWTMTVNKIQMASEPLLSLISLIADNWSTIEPIFFGLAAGAAAYALGLGIVTAAHWIADGAAKTFFLTLLKNPLTIVAVGIGVLIGFIYKAIQAAGGFKIAWMKLKDMVLSGCDFMSLGIRGWVNWALDDLGRMKVSGLQIIDSFINGAINKINKLIGLANKIPGVSIETISYVSSKAETAAAEEAAKSQQRSNEFAVAQMESRIAKAYRQREIDNAMAGKAKESSEFDSSVMSGDVESIADNTGSMKNSLEITAEDLKYLRDLADRGVINRFTTAEIKVDMTNNNTITNTNDIDGLVTSLSVKLREELAATAEGSYSF